MFGVARKGLVFSNDEAGADLLKEVDGNVKSDSWSDEQQQELNKRAAAIKKSAYEDALKKIKAEYESKQLAAQEAEDSKQLEAEGKYKELSEKAESLKKEAEKKLLEAEEKYKGLMLKDLYGTVVGIDKITFVNETAKVDAFGLIDKSKIETEDDMRTAVKEIISKRPHLILVDDIQSNTDARHKSNPPLKEEDLKKREAELKNRFKFNKPR